MDSELDGRGNLTVSESFNGREGYHIATRPKFYTEQFERVCPYYMAMGMTYYEFWDGDVEIAKMTRKAHEIKVDQDNQFAWLQGLYVYKAVGSLAPALKAFAKGKVQPYPKEPFGASERRIAELPEEEREEAKHKREDDNFNAYMMAWMSQTNKRFAKGGETNG